MNGVGAAGPRRGAVVLADRAVGVVLASAAGDALGAGYEFAAGPGPDVPVAMVGGGPFDWAPGELTDDTQMALAVLDPLADGGTGSDALAHVETGFRAWIAVGPTDVGNQTRTVLSTPGPLADVDARYAATHARAAGNGSLMRTGPVDLAQPGDPSSIATWRSACPRSPTPTPTASRRNRRNPWRRPVRRASQADRCSTIGNSSTFRIPAVKSSSTPGRTQ